MLRVLQHNHGKCSHQHRAPCPALVDPLAVLTSGSRAPSPGDWWPWKTPGLQWHPWEAQGHLSQAQDPFLHSEGAAGGLTLTLTAPKVRDLLLINCFSSLLKSNDQLSIFVVMVGFERQQIPHLYINLI